MKSCRVGPLGVLPKDNLKNFAKFTEKKSMLESLF